MTARLLIVFTALLTIVGFTAALPAEARPRDGGETKIFTDVFIQPTEVVDGDVNVVFGDVHVAGIVTGDCNAVFGQCLIEGGEVRGQVHSVTNDGVRALIPWTPNRGFGALTESDHRLFTKLLSSAIVVLIFLLFPLRMRVALDRVERHPGLSAAAGTAAAVLIVPIGLVLLVSLIGIPLIPLEIAAIVALVWIGTGAIALVIGRRLCELVMPAATPSPLVALIVGLVVVSAAEIVPLIGWAVSALVWVVALGAAILSFTRSTNLESALHRAPAGGPPAPRWR